MACRQFIKYFLILFTIIMIAACGSPESKKTKFFDKGKELYTKGNFAKAAVNFGNAIKVDPQFAEAYSMLGQSLLKQMRFKPAYGFLLKAVEIKPDLLDAQAALGKTLLLGREKGMAWEKARMVLAKDPNHREALLLKANCLTVDGKYPESEQIVKTLIEKDPKNTNLYLILTSINLKEGKSEEARKVLRDLLVRDETNKRGRLILIRILEKENRLPDAEEEYKILVKQEPGADEPKLFLAQFYNRTNRQKKAEAILKDLVAANPDKIEPRLYLARFYAENKRGSAMAEVLQKAINDMPDKYVLYEILARYELGERNKDKAVKVLNQYIARTRTGPGLLKAKLFLAGISYRERKFDDAMKLAEDVLKENPKDVAGHALKGDILVSKKDYVGAIAEYRTVLGEEPENIAVSLGLARTHIFNNEPAIAKDIYRKVLDKNPNVGEAMLALGNMALEEKNLEQADRYYSRLLKLAPKSPVPYYKKGIVKRLEKKGEEAAALFEKALEANIDFTPALIQSLDPLVREKKLDEAIVRVQQQIEKSPKNSSYYVLLGRLYAVKKDYSSARKNYEKAFEINPNSQQALFSLAQLEQSQGSIDKALENYRKMRVLNPENPRIALLTAMTLEQKGEHKQAIVIYEEVLEKNPGVPLAANNLAFYLAEYEPTGENLERAEKLIAPLLEKYKNAPSLVDTGAWVYCRKGEYKKARDLLLGIDEKARNIPAISYHLGMIYLGLGEKDKAKDCLQRALKGEEEFPGRQEAEKEMKKFLIKGSR